MLTSAFLKPIILSVARHLASSAGAALATYGIIAASQVEAVTGAILTLITVGVAAWDKTKK